MLPSLGFRSGFRVQSSGFSVQASEFRVGFRVHGLEAPAPPPPAGAPTPGLRCAVVTGPGGMQPATYSHFRTKREQLERFWGLLPESLGQNLALTVVYVPCTAAGCGNLLRRRRLTFEV